MRGMIGIRMIGIQPRQRALCAVWALLLGGCAALSPPARTDGSGLDVRADRLIVVTVANAPVPVSFDVGSTPHPYAAPRPYTAARAARAQGAALARDYHLRILREWPIAALKVDCFVYALAPDRDRASVLEQLANDARVRLAEPLQLFDTQAFPAAKRDGIAASNAVPNIGYAGGDAYNDPYFRFQQGFRAIGADLAQRRSRGGGVRVAIIDTGVDVRHPDMAHAALVQDFFSEDAAAFRSDRHGTAVVGIIAAAVNNHIGIVGMAPDVRLQIYKACQPIRPGALAAQCNSFTLAQALDAAIVARAQVVNLSLYGPNDPLLAALVRSGQRRGCVFVGALPASGRLDGFPLSITGVIAAGEPGSSSGSGRADTVLHAPGREILSLAPAGRYDFVSGSSFATAYVTAAIAMLRARAPSLDSAALRAVLASTQRGSGDALINICSALARVMPDNGTTGVTRCTARASQLAAQ